MPQNECMTWAEKYNRKRKTQDFCEGLFEHTWSCHHGWSLSEDHESHCTDPQSTPACGPEQKPGQHTWSPQANPGRPQPAAHQIVADQCLLVNIPTVVAKRSYWTRSMNEIVQLTAAMEGLLSSPGWGWVTSAPNIIVGLSVTKGMHLDTASASTVFLPPTFENKRLC
jgi:hypothetical protein